MFPLGPKGRAERAARASEREQGQRIRDLKERELEQRIATAARRSKTTERRRPCRIPTELVEIAVQMHADERVGRRKISERVAGVTEYQAGQILRWYKNGKPGGLWLEDGRLKWSRAISTTRDGMLLPRI